MGEPAWGEKKPKGVYHGGVDPTEPNVLQAIEQSAVALGTKKSREGQMQVIDAATWAGSDFRPETRPVLPIPVATLNPAYRRLN